MIHTCSKHLGSLFGSVIAAVGSMMAAAIVGFLAAVFWFYASPPEAPGDRIAAGAKEVFVGRVVAVTDEFHQIHLRVDTDHGPREVVLAEVGLVPAYGAKLSAWREHTLGLIRSELIGTEVAVFAARPRNPYGPTLAHVGRKTNDWLNGSLVERGLCYTVRMAPSQQVAMDDLADLEQDARERKRGCWAFVNRDLSRTFTRHL